MNLVVRDLVLLEQMRAIKHENVVEFIGVCIEAPTVAIVMFHTQRGSLQDVILSCDRRILSLDFMSSLLMDACKVHAFSSSFDSLIGLLVSNLATGKLIDSVNDRFFKVVYKNSHANFRRVKGLDLKLNEGLTTEID